MDQLRIGNTVLNYQITTKNNKNTYFYFKKKGYIQINASKNQKKKDIVKFIKENSESFIKKYNKLFEVNTQEDGYRIWGNRYQVSRNISNEHILFDHELLIIKEPKHMIDQLSNIYKDEEKKLLLEEAYYLKEKYLNNELIEVYWDRPTPEDSHAEIGLNTGGNEIFLNTLSLVEDSVEVLSLGIGIQIGDNFHISWDNDGGVISNFEWSGNIINLPQFYVSINLPGDVLTIDGEWIVGDEGSFGLEFNRDVDIDFVNVETERFKVDGTFHD